MTSTQKLRNIFERRNSMDPELWTQMFRDLNRQIRAEEAAAAIKYEEERGDE